MQDARIGYRGLLIRWLTVQVCHGPLTLQSRQLREASHRNIKALVALLAATDERADLLGADRHADGGSHHAGAVTA